MQLVNEKLCFETIQLDLPETQIKKKSIHKI